MFFFVFVLDITAVRPNTNKMAEKTIHLSGQDMGHERHVFDLLLVAT